MSFYKQFDIPLNPENHSFVNNPYQPYDVSGRNCSQSSQNSTTLVETNSKFTQPRIFEIKLGEIKYNYKLS